MTKEQFTIESFSGQKSRNNITGFLCNHTIGKLTKHNQ